MVQLLNGMLNDATHIIQAAIALATAVYVASTWWRTRALIPTLTAIVMAGIVVWASSNVDLLGKQINIDAVDWVQGAD